MIHKNEKKEKNIDENENININEEKKENNINLNEEEKIDDKNKTNNYSKISFNSESNALNNNENNNIENPYPKFSITSNKNDKENNNIENPYPKFSITSNKNDNENNNIENPYPKFSITKENNENKELDKNDENNNIINDNNGRDFNKTSNLSLEENNNIKKKKNDIVNPNIIYNKKKQNNSTNNILGTENNNILLNNYNNSNYNNLINTNTSASFYPFGINSSLNENEEEEKNENHNKCVVLLSLFRKPQILKLFFVLILTMGSMISNVNNIKFIVSSISSNHSLSLTSLDKYPLIYFSFNSLSRVITGGSVQGIMGTEYTFSALYIITIIGFWSQLIGCFMSKFTIYISIALAGITHGSLMTFVPLYCRYYFNVNDLGTVLGFLTTGNAIGSIFIATLIFPHYYHQYSQYDKYYGEYCSGKRCFRKSYGINTLFMLIAIILSYWIYDEDKKKKLKKKKDIENMNKNMAEFGYNNRIS